MKYEIVNGRIRALRDFNSVRIGDIGGYVDGYHNLSQEGGCWVFNNARVERNAYVGDFAQIAEEAVISGNAMVLDYAVISGKAKIHGNAVVSGYARVTGAEDVGGSPDVADNAVVLGNSELLGPVKAHGASEISGHVELVGTSDRSMDIKDSRIAGNNIRIKEAILRGAQILDARDYRYLGSIGQSPWPGYTGLDGFMVYNTTQTRRNPLITTLYNYDTIKDFGNVGLQYGPGHIKYSWHTKNPTNGARGTFGRLVGLTNMITGENIGFDGVFTKAMGAAAIKASNEKVIDFGSNVPPHTQHGLNNNSSRTPEYRMLLETGRDVMMDWRYRNQWDRYQGSITKVEDLEDLDSRKSNQIDH